MHLVHITCITFRTFLFDVNLLFIIYIYLYLVYRKCYVGNKIVFDIYADMPILRVSDYKVTL